MLQRKSVERPKRHAVSRVARSRRSAAKAAVAAHEGRTYYCAGRSKIRAATAIWLIAASVVLFRRASLRSRITNPPGAGFSSIGG